MTDMLDTVRRHYQATGLVDRLKGALAVLGPQDQRLTPQQLGALDQFHTRGLAATADLARLAGIEANMSILDVGSGVGGPARFLNEAYGCEVVGIDLSEPFVEAARYLTERTGQQRNVSFQAGSALDLPFENGRFDAVFLQHVAMNIADRKTLYAEIRRVLKERGRLATFDIVMNKGEPEFPVPWARTPEGSFLMTADATREAIEAAGFVALSIQDDTEVAKTWLTQMRASGPPPSPNLGVVMGPDTPQLITNLGRNLLQDRLGVLTAVFEAS
ncbi:MAG TPA: class I SAM-dependent methyltransferase [Steroidobacteraceae bacterium]|jgi:SAM-dependent methyltransferase